MNVVGQRPHREPRRSVLIYRDRIAPRSEAQFLRRQYVGFERLAPVWVGCRTDEGLADLGAEPLILGRPGALGSWDRARFKQFGVLPPQPDLRALRAGVVHAQFGRGGALALPIARALGIPLAVTFHGGDATKEKHYARSIFPTIFQRRLAALQQEAALFICVSQFISDRLAARGFPQDKLRVIRLGVEVQRELPIREPMHPAKVVFVGRFVEKKGITYLIEAVRALAANGTPVGLVLVGDGPLMGALKQQAHDLPDITFTGWLPSTEVRRHLRGAAALCAPSVASQDGDTDGLPTVILEAMADGVPVIGSRQSGIAEAVEHRVSGLLVPPASPSALAEAIEAIVTRPDWRAAMGAAAHRTVLERFNATTQSRLLEDTLIEMTLKNRAEDRLDHLDA
jgi:colanic acid/amylovoran biosynthesis glycosyltransferase